MAYIIPVEMVAGGVTELIDPTLYPEGDIIIYLYATSSFTLTGDINIGFTNNCGKGYKLVVYQSAITVSRGGRRIEIVPPTGGFTYNEDWQFGLRSVWHQLNADDSHFENYVWWDLVSGTGVDASTALLDESVTLNKLVDLTDGSLIVGNSSNRPAEVALSGDVTMNNLGVTAIGNDKITNAMVKSNAAIARTKLASGTADQVVINNGSGVMTSEAQLAAERGGTGHDFSSSTGFQTWSAGTASVGAITFDRDLLVSFETGLVGDFKIKWDFDGECTGIYGFLTKAIGAADATVTPKNQSGTTLTGGVLTFTASDPKGTAETSVPSANNTFSAGDIWTFTTAGGSAAGYCQLSISYTRTS